MSKRVATLVLTLVLAMTAAVHGRPQDGQHVGQRIVRARVLNLGGLGLAKPAGLAYSSSEDLFFLIEADRSVTTGSGEARIGMLARRGEPAGNRRLPVDVIAPASLAYDDLTRNLYALEEGGDLFRIEMGDGASRPAAAERLHLSAMGLSQPSALAFDGASGVLFILDRGTSSLLRVPRSAPDEAGRRGADAIASGTVSRINLKRAGLTDLKGVAVSHDGSRIYVLSGAARRLYEIAPGGEVVTAHDLSGLGLTDPQTLALAPSGDPTDDPAQQSLYLIDGGEGDASARSEARGSVVELYLLDGAQQIQAVTVQASVENFQSSLVRTVDTSRLSPPSPDPSGVAYMNPFGRLMFSDGEVEEMSIWAGANLFEVTPTGSLRDTASTTNFSDEPVGAAFNQNNWHLFISDDDLDRIFEIDSRGDGLFGTGDDVITSVSTLGYGSDDPEGLAFDSVHGYLYISDGEGREVYQIRPGPDGRFNGVPPAGDDQVSHFDLFVMGLLDTEGIEYNPDLDRLYVVDRGTKVVAEMTTTGTLMRMIDISAAASVTPAGLTSGPSSYDPGVRSLYIVDRGIDNDSHPNENDGKLYEMTLPGPPPPPGQTVLDVRVAMGADDAEEDSSGKVTLTSSDLDMTLDGTTLMRMVGLRFNGVSIPRASRIVSAYVQFRADEISSDPTSLTIRGQNADNALAFTTATTNLSTRPATSAAVTWSPPAWTIVNQSGPAQRTPDLSPVLQQIVSRNGWVQGNSLGLMIAGSGRRVADPFEGGATAAPLLHVIYEVVGGNQPPVASAGPDQTVTIAAGANLSGGVTDDGLPTPPGQVTVEWTQVSGPGTATFTSPTSLNTAVTFSAGGTYILRLTANDSVLTGSDDVTITVRVNQPPVANAGPDQTVSLGAGANLSGSVSDDGLPSPPNQVTVEWTQAGGPGIASFTSPTSLSTAVTFSVEGIYILRLTASDGALTGIDDVRITALGNQPPVANAGPDRTVTIAAGANLSGSVSDDGLPNPPNQVTVEWTQVSGPGTASFSSPTSLNTAVVFSVEGTYLLRLTASDSVLTGSDDVTITVLGNQPPVANAGPDQMVTIETGANLSGGVTDDGLPNPPGQVTVEWTQLSGPGTATFSSPTGLSTGVSFSVEGVYSLRLTANDSVLTDSDDVTITVLEPGPLFTLDVRVAAGTDDAEERTTGVIALDSSDLDMMLDGTTAQQAIGLRFNEVAIPPGSTIVGAYIQFQADEATADPTTLTIRGEDADNAAPFTTAVRNISSRPTTSASATWSPGVWTLVGEIGPAQRTSGLESIIQQIVRRPGWAGRNAMTFIITGSGRRVAEPLEGSPAGAPLLHVLYQTPGGNQMPLANAGPDQTVTLAAGAQLNGSVSDDGLPDPPGQVSVAWTQIGGPGTATFTSPAALSTGVTFSGEGTYTLRLTVDDSALTDIDDVTIAVIGPGTTHALDVRVAAGPDDVEQRATGAVVLDSSDLDMMLDGTSAQQAVGLRFNGVTIPQGSTIVGAYLQFQVDEATADPTTLTIRGENADNATPFATISGNVSSRPTTSATTSWSPAAWTLVGEVGPAQQTPGLGNIIQEIVGRPGWAGGNSMVIIITGSGRRVAKPYEGSPTSPPRLHVEFRAAGP